ncbi:MAG TPA: PLDc N-terminal domain-containing protein [Thermoanaerobaculia bacterium]|jgi:hypothetical protein
MLQSVSDPTPVPTPDLTPIPSPSPETTATAADAVAGMACCGSFLFVILALVALSIALLVWVARDAKARGMDGAVIWMMVVFFTSVIGLIVYLLSRPQGALMRCARCGNKRLQASKLCPHCGNE